MQICNTLLVVDDIQINRTILRAMFEDEYDILEAENGEQALTLLRKNEDQIVAVLLDLLMPVKNGYEVLQEMEADGALSRIPVVVITAEVSAESEIRTFDLGAADVITKPFESHAVKRRVKNAADLYRHKLHLEELVEEQSACIRESNTALIDGLSSVIEHRSMESGQHIRRIRGFTRILLKELAREHQEYGLDEHTIQIIASASSLHDIGKIAIPDAILNKPGKLTPEEFMVMKTHTIRGCEILASLDRMREPEYLRYAYHICRYHHERWDGRGYPDGLKENSIPLCAQVAALADCFDALTTDRVYKKAIPQSEAYNMILHGECGVFSPMLLESFKNVQTAFLTLSKKYADGLRTADESDFRMETALSRTYDESSATLGQSKLFALLHYLNATVLEVDQNSGTYHLLYQADHNFSSFQQEKTIQDAGLLFIRECVYPEDQSRVLDYLNGGYKRFFDEGLFSVSSRYRILDQETGEYLWYHFSLLRLESDPHHCRALIVWRKEPSTQELVENSDVHPAQCGFGSNIPVAGVRCKNDRWLTIVEMNAPFLQLVGYQAAELKNKFKNRLIELVDPVDRERVISQIHRLIHTGRQSQIEYRLRAKDGHAVWVLENDLLVREKNGEEYIQSILTDISANKKVQEELRQNLERYRIAVQQEGDIVFEWNIPTDHFWTSGNWEMKFGFQPSDCLIRALDGGDTHLYPIDVENVKRAIQSILSGDLRKEVEFRFPVAGGQYRWQRARASIQLGSDGKPRTAIGVVVDIEEEKRAIQGLMNQAQRDSLTKLYHKAAAQDRIQAYLEQMEQNDMAALMLIDVDDFKAINDHHGHLFGDAVLVELSNMIGKVFQDGDVVARIGGDEFMAFMPFLSSEAVAVSRARQILENCRKVMQENLNGLEISCSVGLAISPKHGTEYKTLFQNCDQALYQAKASGKGAYAIYSHRETWLKTLDGEYLTNRTRIDSEADLQLELSNIISETFQQLVESRNFEKTVHQILARLGQLFYVSRVYIYEDSKDGKYCRNTFEWSRDDLTPYDRMLQNICYRDFKTDYRKNFDEQGIFYCQNVDSLPQDQRKFLSSQKTLSTLQCSILDSRKFVGFVGFDDCEIHRFWTQAQIDAISFASKIIFMFLMRERREHEGTNPKHACEMQ